MDEGKDKNKVIQEKNGIQAALSFQEVRKEYGDFCLGPLTLSVPEGCITGLVGENGAGKTTLMKAALGMALPDGGTVSCLGCNPVREGKQARKEVGVVFGELQLPGNFTARMAGKFWQEIYEGFDGAYFKRIQERFAVPENKPVRQLSAGMKAKLALAGAVSHHPRLLILDEPLNGLDPLAKDEAVELLRELGEEEVTILISSHTTADLEKLADYLAFLHNGKLALFDEKDGLLERYRTVQGAEETLDRLRQQNIRLLGMRRGAFGAWAIFDRASVQNRAVLEDPGLLTGRASLEEIVTCLLKEERAEQRSNTERRKPDERTFI